MPNRPDSKSRRDKRIKPCLRPEPQSWANRRQAVAFTFLKDLLEVISILNVKERAKIVRINLDRLVADGQVTLRERQILKHFIEI
jgi:hypothetical protein